MITIETLLDNGFKKTIYTLTNKKGNWVIGSIGNKNFLYDFDENKVGLLQTNEKGLIYLLYKECKTIEELITLI